MIKRRLILILLYLLKQKSFITINDIADHIKVSNRTIRNDLNLLKPWIEELNLELIKKTGVGIKISGDPQDELKAYDFVKEKKLYPYPNGPEERLNYIALKLCTVESYRIYQFSDDLYVSRASIHKDLVALKKLLASYHIEMNRDSSKGISISGKEKNIRNMMFSIMTDDEKFNAFIKMCKSEAYECNGDFIFYGLNITDDEIKDFIIKSGLRNLEIYKQLSLINISQIVIRLIISFIRSSINKTITLSDDFIKDLDNQDFKQEIKQLLNNISENFKIDFPIDEYYYIQVFFLAFLQPQEKLPYNIEKIKLFTDYLINAWSNSLNIDLSKDDKLRKSLISHLIPVYTRTMHSIPVENTLKMEIQSMYPNTLKIVQQSVSNSEEWSSMQVEDVEYLTLHLAAALEREKEPLNALLIYSGGLGARILIKEKIERAINEVKIIRSLNYNQINETSFNSVDLIISTVDLKLENNIPLILVNNIISDYDLSLLQDVAKEHFKEKNSPKRIG